MDYALLIRPKRASTVSDSLSLEDHRDGVKLPSGPFVMKTHLESKSMPMSAMMPLVACPRFMYQLL